MFEAILLGVALAVAMTAALNAAYDRMLRSRDLERAIRDVLALVDERRPR